MILRNMLKIVLALLCVHKTGAETTKLEHELTTTVQLENEAEVGRNTAEYQGCHVMSRLVSMLEMRLENAERQLSELKDVKEKANTLENKLKDVTERLNHADKRIVELEVLVKNNIADNQTIPKQLYDEERNYQVNKNHGESSLQFLSDELNHPERPNNTSILKTKTGNFYRVRRDTGSRHVAFTVALLNHITSIGTGQTVPFDAVLYNEENHYNSNSHMFTCPVPGTYLFTLSVTCGSGNIGGFLSLMVNGDAKMRTVSSPGSLGLSNQGSSTIVTRCEAGQNVWASAGGAVNFLHGYYYTSFSGVLLWTDPLGSK